MTVQHWKHEICRKLLFIHQDGVCGCAAGYHRKSNITVQHYYYCVTFSFSIFRLCQLNVTMVKGKSSQKHVERVQNV